MRGILFVLSLACPVNALLQWLFVGGPLGLGLIGR